MSCRTNGRLFSGDNFQCFVINDTVIQFKLKLSQVCFYTLCIIPKKVWIHLQTLILPNVYTGFNTLSRLIFLYVTVTPVVHVTNRDTFTDILPIVYTGFNTFSRFIFLYVTVTPVVHVTNRDTFTDILPIVYTGFNTLSRLIFLYVTVTPVVHVTNRDTFTDILPNVYTGFNTLSLVSSFFMLQLHQ